MSPKLIAPDQIALIRFYFDIHFIISLIASLFLAWDSKADMLKLGKVICYEQILGRLQTGIN